ncbi:MAG: Calvin cycle protein CP12 [Cyanobacteria bacterium]|nr:Calvin cycle protein CP12 [Cyanobacteriota bacterium]
MTAITTTVVPTLALATPQGVLAPEFSLEAELRAAREHARRLTMMHGIDARDVAVAWDAVEELMTAKARQRSRALSSFEQYCQDHPDAAEARMYDV